MAIPQAYLLNPDLVKPPRPKVVRRCFADWSHFWRGGYHGLLVGITGSGKSTLLTNLVLRMHALGHRILMRDDTGLSFLPYARRMPMVLWQPPGCKFKLRNQENYKLDIRTYTSHQKVVDQAYSSPTHWHVVLIDHFTEYPSVTAKFYHELFRYLIYRCKRTWEKPSVVLSFDELNDLIQPRGYKLTGDHIALKAMLEYNLRGLRKQKVTILATTHAGNNSL